MNFSPKLYNKCHVITKSSKSFNTLCRYIEPTNGFYIKIGKRSSASLSRIDDKVEGGCGINEISIERWFCAYQSRYHLYFISMKMYLLFKYRINYCQVPMQCDFFQSFVLRI